MATKRQRAEMDIARRVLTKLEESAEDPPTLCAATWNVMRLHVAHEREETVVERAWAQASRLHEALGELLMRDASRDAEP